MDDCPPGYRIDYSPLRGMRASRIALQLPDGLKPYARCIARRVREETGASVVVHGDHVYGSCDLAYPLLAGLLGVDAIVHVGHTPYPREISWEGVEPRGTPRVVYLAAESLLGVPRDAWEEAASILSSHGARRVAVVSTAQHVGLLGEARAALSSMGFEAVVPRGAPPYFMDGQVIGCDYRLARAAEADSYLIVAGGRFHALGLYLSTLRPVVQVDPYRGRALDFTPEGERVYRVRLYKVSQALDARGWAIIAGLRTGQYRPWLVDSLTRRVRERGGEYLVYALQSFDLDHARMIDADWIDAFVVTSCPRIPIDDLASYEKPVLTPGEAFMALEGRLEPYRFPW